MVEELIDTPISQQAINRIDIMLSNQWAIVTGGSSGIGAAIIDRLIQHEKNLCCLAVGRRSPQHFVSSCVETDRIHKVSADISTPEGISAILSALPEDACVKYLIHNAGVLGPIAPLSEIDRSTWNQVVETNISAPLFLTQALTPQLKRCAGSDNSSGTKARVLHISSGAAHNPYVGWGPYCVTKAGLHMMYRCLSMELSPHGILVGSVRPGIVDTDMQAEIRGYDGDPAHFPTHTKFRTLHEAGQLERPENVAAYIHWLLSDISDDEFYAKEWDIRNSVDDERWKKYKSS